MEKIGFFKRRSMDIEAVLRRDPAARSRAEVVLCYPGYKAVRQHRTAHFLWKHGFKLLARMISQHTVRRTGIEIHPGAVIGDGLFIDHGNGVVIGETTVIGDNVTLYQGVTLGGTGKDTGKRHPTLEDDVVIGSGAKVLGPFRVGDNARIAANSVVLREVPPNSTVVGVPGRVVRIGGEKLDQVHTPDPVMLELEELRRRISELEKQLKITSGGDNDAAL